VASVKDKRRRERLEQIKFRAAELAASAKDKAAANLAEEAAGIALELLEEK
jgi:hypothetical protein